MIRKKIGDSLEDSRDTILFILQNPQKSFDNDYYCVFKGDSSSKVIMFSDENKVWNEIFIDNESDLNYKLDNFDEIIINFLSQMAFVDGDIEAFDRYKKIALSKKNNYVYPPDRIWTLKYRISTLFSKYKNYIENSDELQSKFILNSLNYPLFLLILVSNKITPDSPKNWIKQLKEIVGTEEFKIMSSIVKQSVELGDLQILINKYVGDIDDKLLLSKNKSLTFIN